MSMVVMVMVGCSTAPKSAGEKQDLQREAETTLASMKSKDPSLADALAQSAGYVVFPSIGKGGVVVGGAFGRGVLYQDGRVAGNVKVEQANIGAVLGGQTFSEVLVLHTSYDVVHLKNGDFKLGANAGAVVIREGAAAAATMDSGSAAFVMPRGGAMVDVSVDGQRFKFEPGAG